ncbi:MAG: M48 family metallopeptidase [Bacteroidia bacterium]
MSQTKHFQLLLIGLLFACSLQAQTLFHSHGTLPSALVGKPEVRAKKQIDARKAEGDLIDEAESAFIYLTEYSFASFAGSGRLSTGDSVSNYAGRILDKLLAKDPKLRKKITVYTLRSTEVNAFMMANGALLLSTGLIAHIENEAQLAFILSHEVVHFRERHNLQGFRNRQRAENTYFDPMAGVLRFTRDLELEADEEGVKIFRAYGYALHEGYSALKLLEHHDWSFGQVPMYPTFFEHGDYRFPESYTLNTIAEVEKDDAERDESRSTHPGLDKRLRVIAPLLGDTAMRTPLFQISESGFRYLQDLCRREVINLYLEERNYPEAIYGAYVLLHKDSNDIFARDVIGKSLYNLAVYYSESEFYQLPNIFIYEQSSLFANNSSDEPDYTMQGPEEVPGECQRLVHFFHKLHGFEWTVLALDWNWKLNVNSGYEEKNNQRCLHLMEILKAWQYLEPRDFSSKAYSPVDSAQADDYKSTNDLTSSRLPKVSVKKISEKITDQYKDRRFYTLSEFQEFREELQKEIDEKVAERQKELLDDQALLVKYKGKYTPADTSVKVDSVYFYYRYAFVNYMGADNKFRLNFEDVRESHRTNPYEDFDVVARTTADKNSRYGLGSSRIAVMDPQFYWLGEIKRSMEFDYDPSKSAAIAPQQMRAMESAGKAMKMEMLYMIPERMDSLDSTDFSTYCMLKAWLNERGDLGSNSLSENMAFNSLGDSIAKRLGTPYVMLNYVTTKHVKRVRNPPLYVLGLLVPFVNIPVLIYGLIPNNNTQLTTVVYDLNTGDTVMLYQEVTKGKANEMKMMQYFNSVFKKTKQPRSE